MAAESTTHIERRSSPRVPVRYPIVYFYAQSGSPPMHMLDLSAGGASIEANDPLPVGAAVAFMIIADKSQVVEANATVMHVQAVPDIPYRIGVSFKSLSPKDRRILFQAIQPSGTP